MPSEEVSQWEAHGTGTGLGDPIEVRSLASAVLTESKDNGPLSIGGLKANVGHGEAAAGASGLIQLSTALQGRRGSPNAQLLVLNAHIGAVLEGASSACFPVQHSAFGGSDARAAARSGGVSSFGYSGTIANVLLNVDSAPTAMHFPPQGPEPLAYLRRRFEIYP
eukprot:scaffold49591_cov511-Isochrysis_galbana.AAC.1